MLGSITFIISLSVILAAWVYVICNDKAFKRIPQLVQDQRDRPWTTKEILETAAHVREHPVDIRNALPPRTSRRYIITGGVRLFPFSMIRVLLSAYDNFRQGSLAVG